MAEKDAETREGQLPVQATTVRSEWRFKPSSHTEIHIEFSSRYLFKIYGKITVFCLRPPSLLQTKSHCEEKAEASRVSSEKEEVKEEQSIVGGQPFFQAPQRESVIFFSTGKTLLRAPRFEKRHEPHGPVLPVHEEMSSVSVPVCQTNPSVQSLHRGNADIP